MVKKKSPFIAAILSLLIAGAGQLYLNKPRRGAFFLFLEVSTLILFLYYPDIGGILNLSASLVASYDAYKIALKINQNTSREDDVDEEEIPVVFIK